MVFSSKMTPKPDERAKQNADELGEGETIPEAGEGLQSISAARQEPVNPPPSLKERVQPLQDSHAPPLESKEPAEEPAASAAPLPPRASGAQERLKLLRAESKRVAECARSVRSP